MPKMLQPDPALGGAPTKVKLPEFQHDFEIVISQVLNGGFSQLWWNFNRKRGYAVPQMIARASEFASANGWEPLAVVLEEAENVDGDESQMSEDDPEWEEMESELDQLDTKLYAAWDQVEDSVKQTIDW